MTRRPKLTRASARHVLIPLVVAALMTAGACGDDDVDPVTAAKADVRSAEKSVTEATAALADATDEACGAARDYITAIDRYGDVLEDSAPTVGDVRTAGADLEEPRADVSSSIDEVTEARDQLAGAEQDLAEARAELAALQPGSSPPDTTTTTTSTVPAATVDRAKQAESDLAAAAEGITDETALSDAGEEYNAAAFALEVAWLRLFADAGCFTDEEQAAAVTRVADYTAALQRDLATAGYYDGPVDGVYGPTTVDAVKALQSESDLPATGFVDRATATALDDKLVALGDDQTTQAVADTAAVQAILKAGGYWTGAVDGEWTPELTEALKKLQTDLEVPATGVVDAATLHALTMAVEKATTTPSTTTASTPSTSTTTTSTP